MGTEVLKKLLNVQTKLKAPKNQYSDYGNYYYRNCEDILQAVKPLNKKEGLVLLLSDEVVIVNERYYIKATAKVYDIETGESIQTSAFAREDLERKKMDCSQLTGSASSYARKYALNGLYNIDDVKDSDALGSVEDEENKKERIKKQNDLMRLVDETNTDFAKLLESYKVKSIADLKDGQIDDANKILQKRVKK